MAKKQTGSFAIQLKVKDLVSVHDEYGNNINEWRFTMALYEGIREVVRLGLVEKHEREGIHGYQRRMKELVGLGYSKSVVEIFHFYLFKKDPKTTLGALADDELYRLFLKDADLYGNDLKAVLMEFVLYSAVEGHMGILVDKPNVPDKQTRKQEIDAGIYPYLAKYFPPAILDWKWEKNENKRPHLSFLKLVDDNQQYRIWTPEYWEVWELPKDNEGNFTQSNEEQNAVFIEGGINPIAEIPFIWHYNLKSRKRGIGMSDIHEIARIDLSIIRNLSQVEGIINFAAFPMMRKPMRDAKPTEINAPQQDDEVGVDVVLEFDPEHPDSKPDWLPSSVQDAVSAIIEFIGVKISEIYRSSNIGGMAATEPTKSPQSGVAKRIDFQLLNSKLVSKATNLEDTENRINYFFLKWQNLWDKFKDIVTVQRDKEFDIEDIATELENVLTAKTIVISKLFKSLLQKRTARQMLPGASEKELEQIDKEIEESVEKEDEFESQNTNDIDDDDIDPDTKKIIDDAMKKKTNNFDNNNFNKQQGEE